MTLGEVRAMFQKRLNRTDCTPDLADGFLALGMVRVQRELRAPPMERVEYADATTQPIETLAVPPDYIELIDVVVSSEPFARERVAFRLRNRAEGPCVSRYRNLLYFVPPIPKGARVDVLYYGNFTAFTSDDDVNELSSSAPDLLVYAALTQAADHFVHEKAGEWEARYQTILGTVQAQAVQDEFAGSIAVQPAYPGA